MCRYIAIYRHKYGVSMHTINFFEAAECLKTLAHPDRLYLVFCLIEYKQLSVGELAKCCALKNHVASEHLTLMKDRGFIEAHREGRKVIYKIKETALLSIMDCIRNKFKTSP